VKLEKIVIWFSEVKFRYGIIICCILAIVIALLLNFLKDNLLEDWYSAISNTLIALSASVMVSFLWNKVIFDHTQHYAKSGIRDYFDDFSEVQIAIAKKIEKAKNVEIFFMYGSTFLNANSSAIKKLMKKKNSNLIVMLADEQNNFLPIYEQYWNYEKDQFKKSINKTICELKKWHGEIAQENRCNLEIYKFTKGCFTYSYYKIDNDIYFVPSKAVAEKSFKPITIYACKTTNENCMYERVGREKAHMIGSGELVKIYPGGSS